MKKSGGPVIFGHLAPVPESEFPEFETTSSSGSPQDRRFHWLDVGKGLLLPSLSLASVSAPIFFGATVCSPADASLFHEDFLLNDRKVGGMEGKGLLLSTPPVSSDNSCLRCATALPTLLERDKASRGAPDVGGIILERSLDNNTGGLGVKRKGLYCSIQKPRKPGQAELTAIITSAVHSRTIGVRTGF